MLLTLSVMDRKEHHSRDETGHRLLGPKERERGPSGAPVPTGKKASAVLTKAVDWVSLSVDSYASTVAVTVLVLGGSVPTASIFVSLDGVLWYTGPAVSELHACTVLSDLTVGPEGQLMFS